MKSCLHIETFPIILYGQFYCTVCFYKGKAHKLRPTVFGNVVEGLLHNPEDDDLEGLWNIGFFHVQLFFNENGWMQCLMLSQKPVDGCEEPKIVENRWTKICHESSGFVDCELSP